MNGRRSRPWLVRWMWLLGPLVTLSIFGGPALLLHLVVSEAEACFASIPSRASAELPRCDRHAHYIAPLVDLPWIGRPAMRAHEEILARAAVWRYLDAAVGEPDRKALTEGFVALKPVAYTIWEGSMRLRMDEVGPPMPVPEPGMLAYSAGDRVTLDGRALEWTQHYTQTRAMEAALLEGRFDRAVRLAEHYQGRPNTDLRVRVGALLCAGGEYERGIDQVLDVEHDRARHRTANFARNFGGARVVHEVCARRAKLVPAPAPAAGDAGVWDHRERLLAARMRWLRAQHPACDISDPLACRSHDHVAAALEEVRELLRMERPRRHRLALFASIADGITSPSVALKYGMPRPGEPSLTDLVPLFADEWLDDAADAPFITAERYERAAAHLAELAAAEAMDRLVQTLFVRAAVGFAQRGDLGAADRCIVKAKLKEPALVITRANAALIAGDREEARKRAGREAARHPRLLLLRAALALPDVDLARAGAKEAFEQAEDAALTERARWFLAASGVRTGGKEVLAADALDTPPRYRYAGWRDALTSDAVRSANLDDTLAVWHRWIHDDNRRQSRYHAFAHRGDAPVGLTSLLHAAGQLSSPDFSSEQTEMWLDAVMAFDARRFTIRQVAFARWQAAEWRGDTVAAQLWRQRFRKVAALSQDPEVADLLRAARL